MYRLLVVDDEYLIADGLYEMLQNSTLDLELYKCYSAVEALAILRKIRVDIIISDIQMPGMDGIALAEQVNRIWPNCRIIFLSGYKDVNYAIAAIRNNIIDYVLKTESDDRLLNAVQRAMDAVAVQRRTWHGNGLTENKKSYEYSILSDILFTDRYQNMTVTDEFWERLETPILRGESAVLVLGSVKYPEPNRKNIQQEVSDAILLHNSFMLHMRQQYRIFYDYRDRLAVWVLQPKDPAGKKDAFNLIPGMVEEIQQFCFAQNINANFAINLHWESIGTLHAAYQKTRRSLLYPEQEGENLILSMDSAPQPVKANGERFQLDNADERISQMYLALLKKEKANFFDILYEIQNAYHANLSLSDLNAVRTYMMMLNILAKYLQQQLPEAENLQEELSACYQLSQYTGWKEALQDMDALCKKIFSATSKDGGSKVGETIKTTIQNNLSKNYSLIELAEIVHLNPYYLSRYFKKIEGVTLSEYISHIKMDKAKELLRLPDIKILEVSGMLGFDSNSYFSKCFKKEFGISPLDYQRQSENTLEKH